MTKEVVRWGDSQQYYSEPMPEKGIQVTLLNTIPDPLGTLAALCGIYEGKVIRDTAAVTNEERKKAFEAMLSTELRGPLEAIPFTFLIEGVDRAFTHQMVRERQAFFAQESLRFAVKEEFWNEVELPPSLQGLNADDPKVLTYRTQLKMAGRAYQALVNDGMPAEEARKLLPHAVTTRLFWSTSLRSLLHVAGLRTCTQAEFTWRVVMSKVAAEIRAYARREAGTAATWPSNDRWQMDFIADQLRPVCYQTGRCGFMAKFDRECSIRDRVEENAKVGRPSSEWPFESPDGKIAPIHNFEWAADPAAARIV
jgi:flavin-dependent thymidylate synthase